MANKTGKIDWSASTPIERGEGEEKKTNWTNLGIGFDNKESGTITVFLAGTPVNGKLVLRRPEPKE